MSCILYDTGCEKYKLPHMSNVAWLAVGLDTSVERKKMENGPITLYFTVVISKLANDS